MVGKREETMTRVLNTASMFLSILVAVTLSQIDISPKGDIEPVLNDSMEIEGFVIRCLVDTFGIGVYQMRNEFGGIVTIRTGTEAMPKVGEYLRINGIVAIDSILNIPSILENERTSLPDGWVLSETGPDLDSDEDGVPDNVDECPHKKGYPSNRGCPTLNYALLGLIATAVTLFIIVIWAFTRLRSLSRNYSTAASMTKSRSSTSDVPDPIDYIEGSVIKFHTPPPDTLKLLPGYFEIVGGETKLEEVRLFQISEEPVIETTIGRLPGEPYRHIQLQSHTVSRKQAKLFYTNEIYSLTNYAPKTSNPTMINGEEMIENETRVLEEGDRIAMGEVELIYHVH